MKVLMYNNIWQYLIHKFLDAWMCVFTFRFLDYILQEMRLYKDIPECLVLQ